MPRMRSATKREVTLGALKKCKEEDDVRALFASFRISDDEEKITLLCEAMGNASIYHSTTPSLKDRLNVAIAIFADGEWRADELYELPSQGATHRRSNRVGCR